MAGMRPRVHTEKHITQDSLFTVAAAAISARQLAITVAAPTSKFEVREGSSISALYIEYWITGDDAVNSTCICTLEKRVAGQSAMTAAQSADLHSYPNKANVIHTFQGIIPTDIQTPLPVVKGWFKIPKGKQRMRLGDQWVFNIHGQSDGVDGCGFCIYKEQF